jgi:hypothetical protein
VSRFGAFTPGAAKRVWQATLRSEGQDGGGPGDGEFYDPTAFRIAFTAGGATARASTTPGTGTAILCYITEGGTIAQEENEITFINMASSAVGTNKYIAVIQLGVRWMVIWEECA